MMKNETSRPDLMARSLTALLIWHAGLAADPGSQRGELAASRKALIDRVKNGLGLTAQQRILGVVPAQRGREVFGDLARRHFYQHVARGGTGFQKEHEDRWQDLNMIRSLDRILAASSSVATELGAVLTSSQTRTLDTIAAQASETRWVSELAAMTRGDHRWSSSKEKTRAALIDLAVPLPVVEVTIRHMASLEPGDFEPFCDLRGVLLWLTSNVLAASHRTDRCLGINFLTLFMLIPGFLAESPDQPERGWMSTPTEKTQEKETVS